MSNNPPVESQHTVSKPPSSESLEEDPHDEEESFSTRQLFQFAWQIARGMVATVFIYILSCPTRELAFKKWTLISKANCMGQTEKVEFLYRNLPAFKNSTRIPDKTTFERKTAKSGHKMP